MLDMFDLFDLFDSGLSRCSPRGSTTSLDPVSRKPGTACPGTASPGTAYPRIACPRNRMSNGPAGTGMALSSVRCGFPFARDTRGTPSLAPSGSCFACLGGGGRLRRCAFRFANSPSLITRAERLYSIVFSSSDYRPHCLLPAYSPSPPPLTRTFAPHRHLDANPRRIVS